jgi:hypothetical protein
MGAPGDGGGSVGQQERHNQSYESTKYFMKTVVMLLFTAVGWIGSAKGATLILTGPGGSTSSAVPGAHVDFYRLPEEAFVSDSSVVGIAVSLAGAFSPLIAINANPGGVDTPIRDLAILGQELDNDTHLLFDSAQIASVTDVIETNDLFFAKVNFSMPIDSVPADLTALRSVSGDHSLTSGEWIFSYANGSSRTYSFGIIPEPASGMLIGIGGFALAGRRNRLQRINGNKRYRDANHLPQTASFE